MSLELFKNIAQNAGLSGLVVLVFLIIIRILIVKGAEAGIFGTLSQEQTFKIFIKIINYTMGFCLSIIVLSAAIDLWAKNKSDNIFIDQEKFFGKSW